MRLLEDVPSSFLTPTSRRLAQQMASARTSWIDDASLSPVPAECEGPWADGDCNAKHVQPQPLWSH
eukprot:2989117-Pyramimonas_sp.AAC.1